MVSKQGDTLSPLILQLHFCITPLDVTKTEDGHKLNGIHQPPVYANDVNLLDENVNNIRYED
jgi:hypothetical protein